MTKNSSFDGARAMAQQGDSLVLIFHGYGASGDDLISLAHEWRKILPNTHFIAPNAFDRLPPYGYQWFPIQEIGERSLLKGVQSIYDKTLSAIETELNNLSLSADRLVLAGFSQGCMLSQYIAVRAPFKVAGMLGYSGGAPGAHLSQEYQQKPNYLLWHGDEDEVVPAVFSQRAHAFYEQQGMLGHYELESGLGHGISPRGLKAGGAFIKKCLG